MFKLTWSPKIYAGMFEACGIVCKDYACIIGTWSIHLCGIIISVFAALSTIAKREERRELRPLGWFIGVYRWLH